MFSDIEIPYDATNSSITDVAGRTIHSDGTVIPLTTKPFDKIVIKSASLNAMEKVFTMPDVQVGSIVEYRWKLRFNEEYYVPPQWYIAQPVYVHKAHYHFMPTRLMRNGSIFYSGSLPDGVKVRDGLDGFDLVVENIPALPDEDFMPPFRSFSYRLNFYYSYDRISDQFWQEEGKNWSRRLDHFATPTDKVRAAVQQIVSSSDTDEQKVEKIYAAIMGIENTSFTRMHSAQENRAEGLKVKKAEDIWDQKRGTDDEITELFIAMVRAAGLKAYGMIVVNRDENLFQKAYFDWRQLDDELAIVTLNGKEVYFDPGQRYCAFAKLHWKHTWASGIRQTDKGTGIAETPGLTYEDNQSNRIADLTLDSDGKVHGFIRETLTGADALYWRQAALSSDEDEVKVKFAEELKETVPPGVQVKTNHFVGLSDYKSALLVQVDVTGTLGTTTGKRTFLPAVFFEANAKPLFVQEKRENSVDLHYPYAVRDQVTVTLPTSMRAENIPNQSNLPFPPNADYIAKFLVQGNTFAYLRLLRVAQPFYKVTDYPRLRDFYQKTNSNDREQVVLRGGPAATENAAPPRNGR